MAFWLAHLSDISEQEHFFYFCREICQIFYTKADYRIKNHQSFYLKIPIETKEFISIILLLMTYCYEIITFAPLKIQVETNHLQNILVSENDNSFAFHFGKTSLVSFVKSEFSKNSFILFPKKWKKELCFMATNNQYFYWDTISRWFANQGLRPSLCHEAWLTMSDSNPVFLDHEVMP